MIPPAPPPAARTRPATVAAAAAMQFAVVALLLVGAAVTVVVIGPVFRSLDRTGGAVNGTATLGKVVLGGMIVLYLLFAVLNVVLVLNNLRGRQWSRVTTLVFAGLGLLCCGILGLVGGIGRASLAGDSAHPDTYPSWYTPASEALSVAHLIANAGIVIMLLLPATTAYFRKRPAPVGYGG